MLLLLTALATTTTLHAADTLPWDTAYIDAQTYIDNLADSVQSATRSFQGPGPILVHFEAEIDRDSTDYFA